MKNLELGERKFVARQKGGHKNGVRMYFLGHREEGGHATINYHGEALSFYSRRDAREYLGKRANEYRIVTLTEEAK